MGDGVPRIRLPGAAASGGVLTRPPGTLASLASLGVGAHLVGVADDGSEVTFEVVAAAIDGRPTLEDVVDVDARTGELHIAVGTSTYDPTTGSYAATLTITARPAAT